jgi:hypothetical protein
MRGKSLLSLLRQLHPRKIFGCAMLALAGMSSLLAWLGTLPPRDQLLHLTGQMQELKLRNPASGAFTITLLSAGALHTFEFNNAHGLVGLPSGIEKLEHGPGEITVTLDYFKIGREEKVVDVVFGTERVLSYDSVAGLAASNQGPQQRDRLRHHGRRADLSRRPCAACHR